MSVLFVRRLTSDDWEVLRDLRIRALTDSPNALLGDLPVERDLNESYWRIVASCIVWVAAWFGDQPSGLASLNWTADGAYIESLWVVPDHRGQGVARSMVSALEAAADGDQIYSWVTTENEVADEVIQKLGYRPTLVRQPIVINGQATFEQRYRKGESE